jgi:type III secretion system HrpE/YscL family protein
MEPKILKADALAQKFPISSPKVVKSESFEAGKEAREILELARERARQIVEEAEHQRESIIEQARQDGIAQGLAQWNEILAQATERTEELANHWEETMLRLSIKAAEKIIGEDLRIHPEGIVSIVRETLMSTRCGRHITIKVNDSQAHLVRERVDALKQLGTINEIAVVSSSSVPAGGCVVESELGVIDARLDTQLNCLEGILLRGVPETRAG